MSRNSSSAGFLSALTSARYGHGWNTRARSGRLATHAALPPDELDAVMLTSAALDASVTALATAAEGAIGSGAGTVGLVEACDEVEQLLQQLRGQALALYGGETARPDVAGWVSRHIEAAQCRGRHRPPTDGRRSGRHARTGGRPADPCRHRRPRRAARTRHRDVAHQYHAMLLAQREALLHRLRAVAALVRDAVEALPIDEAAGEVRTALAGLGEAISEAGLAAVPAAVESVHETVAGVASEVAAALKSAVESLLDAIDSVAGRAETCMDSLEGAIEDAVAVCRQDGRPGERDGRPGGPSSPTSNRSRTAGWVTRSSRPSTRSPSRSGISTPPGCRPRRRP